jgi:hypothetical protein
MDDNQIYRYFYCVNQQEEVLMDTELVVDVIIDLVLRHNWRLNEEMHSFFDITYVDSVEFYHYERIDSSDTYGLISLKYFD